MNSIRQFLLVVVISICSLSAASARSCTLVVADSLNSTDTTSLCCADTLSQLLQGQDPGLVATAEKNAYKNTRYWNRCRKKTFAGSALLGMGALTLSYYALLTIFDESDTVRPFDMIFLGAGGGLVASSVPLYISAYKDRKKAKRNATTVTSTRDYRKKGFDCEVSVGTTFPTDIYKGMETPLVSYSLGIEGRSYIGDSDFDVGVKFSRESVGRKHETSSAFRLTVFGDYNLFKDSDLRINPFVGVGAGVGLPATLHVEPRVGIELLNRHRLTLQWRKALISSEHRICKLDNVCLSYGFLF